MFDDFKIDFESIAESVQNEAGSKTCNKTLIQYYEEINEVIKKRFDECKGIIEEYFRAKVKALRERLLMINAESGGLPEGEPETIASVTHEHHRALTSLRELHEEFVKHVEQEFFRVFRGTGALEEGGVSQHSTQEMFLEESLREVEEIGAALSERVEEEEEEFDELAGTSERVALREASEEEKEEGSPPYEEE